MPTIKEKLRFNYNGLWSDQFKIINVVLDSSMFEDIFVANREIIETSTRGRNLFHSVVSSPIEFEMTVAFEDSFSEFDINAIIEWLFQDYYKPLYFEGNENKIFMAMPTGNSNIVHNGMRQGYFTLLMRCDSPHVYSPIITTSPETVTTQSPKTITINNDGHEEIYPEISILTQSDGVIEITSLDDDNDIFEIRDLRNGEDLYLNSEKEIIETDAVGETRYDNILGEFPRLLKGVNRFRIVGNCVVKFRYKKKYKF